RLDIMFANAGIAHSAPFLEHAEAQWHRVLRVNLTGVFLCCQIAARQMVKQGGGRLITTASINGFRGVENLVGYNTAKAGVIELTKTMAVELAQHGITLNAIPPPPIAPPPPPTPSPDPQPTAPPGRGAAARGGWQRPLFSPRPAPGPPPPAPPWPWTAPPPPAACGRKGGPPGDPPLPAPLGGAHRSGGVRSRGCARGRPPLS